MQQRTNHRNSKPQNIPGDSSAITDIRVAVKGPSSSTSGGDAEEESKYGKKALKKGVRKGGMSNVLFGNNKRKRRQLALVGSLLLVCIVAMAVTHEPVIRSNGLVVPKSTTVSSHLHQEQEEQGPKPPNTQGEQETMNQTNNDNNDDDSVPVSKSRIIYNRKDPFEDVTQDNGDVLSSRCDPIQVVGGANRWVNGSLVRDKSIHRVCGPRVLIIGAMKCGTNTIGGLLIRHPRMKMNACAEPRKGTSCNTYFFQGSGPEDIWEGHHLTHIRVENPDWFTRWGAFLPSTDGHNNMTFDKSPSYLDTLIFPDVVAYAHRYVPNAKVVVTLCNPTERVYSEWNHVQRWGYAREHRNKFYTNNDIPAPTNFTEFVNLLNYNHPRCSTRTRFCYEHRRHYLWKGKYLSNLEPWLEYYGTDNVLVVHMESDARKTVQKLLDHIGPDLRPEEYPWDTLEEGDNKHFRNDNYKGRSSGYDDHPEAMKKLDQYYAPHNEELAHVLNIEWPRLWNCRVNNQTSPKCQEKNNDSNMNRNQNGNSGGNRMSREGFQGSRKRNDQRS